MNVIPLNNRILIKKANIEDVTKSGFILSTNNESEYIFEVVEVSESIDDIKPGDKIICSKFVGTEVTIDRNKYVIVNKNDILATIDD